MARLTQLRPEPVKPILKGGATRPSRLVDLRAYPAVAQRQSVNARLLTGLCGHGESRPSFSAADAKILAQICRERFDAEHAVLRVPALSALADTGTAAAFQELAAAALSPLEHESVRAAALAAVVRVAPAVGVGLASQLEKAVSPVVRVAARKAINAVLTGAAPARKGRRKRGIPRPER